MLLGLGCHRLLNQTLYIIYASTLAQRGSQVYLLIREKAGAQLAISSQAQPVAGFTEALRNRADKAYGAFRPGEMEIFSRTNAVRR
jgi:hypothetical protein